MAWSGNSGGYIDTVANLGPNVAGQTIKLRFRMGSDSNTSGTGWRVDTIVATRPSCAPVAQSAFSRKMHAGVPFDAPLPLGGSLSTGTLGIEPRRGGGASFDQHQMIVNFATPISLRNPSTVTVTSGVGSVSSFSISGTQAIINLTGVADAQRLAVTMSTVDDGPNTGSVAIPMGVLLGDANNSGRVDSGDLTKVRQNNLQLPNTNNFQADVNASGRIDSGDVTLVRQRNLTALPPP